MPSWKRTYWAVWVANLVTSIGMMSFLPFFPGHLRELGLEDPDSIARWSAAIFGAAPFTAGIMMPIWGAIGDRYGRKVMVLRAMFAICVFVGLMSFAETPLQLFLLRVGQGLFTGFVAPSVTLVSVSAPEDRQGQVTGSLQTALALGSIAGPFLGGLLSVSIGVRGVFSWVALCAFVSALCVAFFAHEDAAQRREPTGEPFSLGELLRSSSRELAHVLENPTLKVAVLLTFLLQFGIGATNPLLELHVGELLAGSDNLARRVLEPLFGELDAAGLQRLSTSAMFGGMSLLTLIGMPLWGRRGDRVGHERTLLASAALSAVALCLHAVAPLVSVLFVARLALGGAGAGLAPSAFGIVAREVGVDRRGGAIGAVVSARTFAISVGAILGGQLVPWIGIRGLYWLGAAVVSVAALKLFLMRRQDALERAA